MKKLYLTLCYLFGAVRKIVKFDGTQKMVNIYISGLAPDIYYVRIFDGQIWEAKQLCKQ